jgi:hypothetical protein
MQKDKSYGLHICFAPSIRAQDLPAVLATWIGSHAGSTSWALLEPSRANRAMALTPRSVSPRNEMSHDPTSPKLPVMPPIGRPCHDRGVAGGRCWSGRGQRRGGGL